MATGLTFPVFLRTPQQPNDVFSVLHGKGVAVVSFFHGICAGRGVSISFNCNLRATIVDASVAGASNTSGVSLSCFLCIMATYHFNRSTDNKPITLLPRYLLAIALRSMGAGLYTKRFESFVEALVATIVVTLEANCSLEPKILAKKSKHIFPISG